MSKFNITGLILLILLVSCKREFSSNEDFNTNVPVAVNEDNAQLFSKIFRFESNASYLWFDIRNEIANFSKPSIGLGYIRNDIARYKQIDLRGRLYSYNSETKELTILGYPLDVATGAESPANLVFGFARKQPDCEVISDPAQRNTCERTFTLSLKNVEFTELNLNLTVGVQANYNGATLKLEELSQELYLTN
ncbi:MAG: hypothetical protein QM594_11230 [Niabella sp.]